jgi:cytochrome P450
MSTVIELSIFVFLSFLGLKFVSYHLKLRSNSAKERSLGCRPPRRQSSFLPFGIDQLIRKLKADRAKRFPIDCIETCNEMGTFTYTYSNFGAKTFFTADPKNIQAILSTNFRDFDLGHIRRRMFYPLLGNGIFTQDGSAWEHSRAMLRPQFLRTQVSDLNLEERHVGKMMEAIVPGENGWTEELNLQPLLFRLTLGQATDFLGLFNHAEKLGLPGATDSPDHNTQSFAADFDRCQATLATRIRFGKLYFLVDSAAFRKSCLRCHEFVDHYVNRALAEDLNDAGKDIEKNNERYVFLKALISETRDPTELRSQILNILLAGRDTTAALMSWVFYCLARDPQRFAKLRAIIVSEFGTYESSSEITFEKLKDCKYLQYCIFETLRLFPSVSFNARRTNKDTVLPTGGGSDGTSPIFVPRNTRCEYSVHVLHHRADIWGPDVEKFNPERWEGRKAGWNFLPFNGGPRVCLGRKVLFPHYLVYQLMMTSEQFAITATSYTIVRLLQKFDIMENLDQNPIAQHNLTLTNSPGAGVKIRLHIAN